MRTGFSQPLLELIADDNFKRVVEAFGVYKVEAVGTLMLIA